jgi:hypothetical protein
MGARHSKPRARCVVDRFCTGETPVSRQRCRGAVTHVVSGDASALPGRRRSTCRAEVAACPRRTPAPRRTRRAPVRSPRAGCWAGAGPGESARHGGRTQRRSCARRRRTAPSTTGRRARGKWPRAVTASKPSSSWRKAWWNPSETTPATISTAAAPARQPFEVRANQPTTRAADRPTEFPRASSASPGRPSPSSSPRWRACATRCASAHHRVQLEADAHRHARGRQTEATTLHREQRQPPWARGRSASGTRIRATPRCWSRARRQKRAPAAQTPLGQHHRAQQQVQARHLATEDGSVGVGGRQQRRRQRQDQRVGRVFVLEVDPRSSRRAAAS